MSVVRGRKSPKAAESLQAMDDYLSSLGLVRKPIAKDGSCLFRAVAEQVFHCQARHLEVREACVRYMDRNRDIFEAFVPGPFDHHLWTLQNPKEWAGQVEISALSLMYKCDFIIYQDVGRPPARVTENGFADKVVLCFSHGNHYDSVYPKQFQIDAAMCQSLVYELLYKDVFKMDHDIAVVKDMLGNKQQKIRKDSTSESESSPSKNCGSDKPDSELEGSTELDVSTESDKSRDNTERPNEKATQANGAVEYSKKDGRRFPLPFKVAKALDPECYRNVEYDTWMDSKKEQQRQDMHLATMMQYAPGDKCQVRLEGNVKYYMAHVQEVQAESGPVTVFIEELGEKHTVPVKNLKPITQVPPVPTVPMPWTAVPAKGYKNLSGYYQKGAIVPQEIAACFSPPWHPFAEDPRNKRKNRRKGRENGIPPFMVQRVQPSLPPRLQHEGQYSPKYHHHHGREYQGRDYQGRDYQGRDYQSREYQGREYQGRDRDYQPRDRDREFQRPPHGQRYNGQASPRYQHYGRDYHSRDYQGRMYHGSPHGHRYSSQGRNQPPRFMRQDQMDGRGPGPRPGSRYQYSHGRGRGRGRNTPTPPPGPPQGEMDEKQAIEESIVLYELQQRDPDAFPALPTSNGQVQHVQSNTVWGRGRGRGMGRRTPTPPPPSTTPSDGGHSMTMEEGSLCSSMQELNMNERASPDGERICSPVSHQMEVPPMKRVMTPTKEFVPRSSRTPSPYQNPTPPLQSQSANAEISSSNSGSNQQMSTDSTSSPASTPNTPPPQTVAPNGYVPYMQPMHVPFYPIMIQATDNLTGPVNLNFGPSRDPYGNDLPHSDVSTLRFFYNLGIEYYRCCMSMMAIQHQQQEAAMANAYFYNQAQGQVQPQYQPASSSDGQNSSGQPAQEGEDPQQEGSDQLPPNGQYYPAQAPGPVDPNPPGSQGPTPIPVPSSAANATYYTAHPGGDMPSHQHYASTYDNQASYQYPATMGGSWQPAHGVPLYGSPNKVTVAYATNSPPVGYQGYTGAPQM
ncbi:putative bifunctional UDP-N-acetylglucosamine transferase and deubiquitinase ALG13 isoform X6 [Branchiostoma floridae]|uniref:Bifunctional UDP-N-acetylglucosamine transferase and deubiquitinase ALG13 isoform X6 n=1 Tax=Branchiostoma floridae TaxID=7739 RepID=A0A9J7LDZ7_BRAFL|nr:putative bifunctional UDP-N-acetylglucosamine transferase and deubiquitinase ALG13 isoform X6 [Branchiostoma floridae]